MIGFERFEHGAEGGRYLLDEFGFLGGEFVQVLVGWVALVLLPSPIVRPDFGSGDIFSYFLPAYEFVGEAITRTSTILRVAEKAGKAGPMAFVTVRHEITTPRGPAIDEEQDIVFLEMPTAFSPPAPTLLPDGLAFDTPRAVDPVLLFRFSALTFNGHRIHYDRTYASEVEKYPGLVVHGPLQAMLLMEAARKTPRTVARFEFRAVRPLFDFDTVRVCGKARDDGGLNLFTANGDGHIGMQAHLHWSANSRQKE